MGKNTFRYKHLVHLKHTEALTVDLPVCAFVNTVEQKWHLRWQCVTVPSRSPDVCMHAADRSRKMGGMDGRGEKKQACGTVCTTDRSFTGQKRWQLIQ